MAMQGQVQGASLNPADMVAGGLIDQANLLVKEGLFMIWDYGKPGGPTTLALKLVLIGDDDSVFEQFFSAGDPKNFVPSADGKILVPVGQATALNENTNMAFLMKNLINSGFPANRLGMNISILEGLYAFWRRVNAPERTGLAVRTDGRPAQVLVPTQILNLPWEQTKRGTPAMATMVPQTSSGSTVASQSSGVDGGGAPAPGDAAAIAEEYVKSTLAQTSSILVSDLTSQAFQAHMTHPQRAEIVDMVYNPQFLAGLASKGILATDGQSVTKAG